MLLGIEIGGTKLQLVAGDEHGVIADRRRIAVDAAAGAEGVRAQIAAALPELIAKWHPTAIGVGYGGPVDWRTGRIACCFTTPGWDGFPLADWLREITGLPVAIENDANTAALGEALHGAGRGLSPVLWVNAGSGVGAGLAVDGRIYHGAPPGELEFGHIALERGGITVEERCSGWAVDARIRTAIAAEPATELARLVHAAGPGAEARQLAPAFAAGCALAKTIIAEVAGDLAFAISHAVYLLSPAIVIFGGGLSLVGEPLRAAIAEALPAFLLPAFRPGPRIVLPGLGEDSVPVGALCLHAAR